MSDRPAGQHRFVPLLIVVLVVLGAPACSKGEATKVRAGKDTTPTTSSQSSTTIETSTTASSTPQTTSETSTTASSTPPTTRETSTTSSSRPPTTAYTSPTGPEGPCPYARTGTLNKITGTSLADSYATGGGYDKSVVGLCSFTSSGWAVRIGVRSTSTMPEGGPTLRRFPGTDLLYDTRTYGARNGLFTADSMLMEPDGNHRVVEISVENLARGSDTYPPQEGGAPQFDRTVSVAAAIDKAVAEKLNTLWN